jgi:hypothetical protein
LTPAWFGSWIVLPAIAAQDGSAQVFKRPKISCPQLMQEKLVHFASFLIFFLKEKKLND